LIAVVIVAIIVMAVVLAFVLSPEMTRGKLISIEDASLHWEYSSYFRGYDLQNITVRLKNVGNADLWFLTVRGEANWAIESGYNDKILIMSNYNEPLKPGQIITVSASHDIIIKQSGTYTLTLQVTTGNPPAGSGNLLAERTMTISVP
jgi:hypothetical protein